MSNIKNKLQILVSKNTLTFQEEKWLLNYIESSDHNEFRELMEVEFENELKNSDNSDFIRLKKTLKNLHKIIKKDKKKIKPIRLWIRKLTVAASLVGLIFLGSYFFYNKDKSNWDDTIEAKNMSFKLSDKAELILSDGSKTRLDLTNGKIYNNDNVNISKLNGKLVYNSLEYTNNSILFNTVTTPRKGKYKLQLPDGSNVWLNVASSLHFPTNFRGMKERRVLLTGQAYFEVAKDKSKPFVVQINKTEVQVLGTHFDVMAYAEEPEFKTTLLEGSIKFVNDSFLKTLKPSQQVQVSKNSGVTKIISNVDINQVVAWKNGYLHFEAEQIETIMRQISRTYDVEIEYSKKSDDVFFVDIPLKSSLQDVLKILELTGKLDFLIQGRKIIVKPK
jgi:ferric-dicitrate binding protein FerR (iron transport regulator)